MNEQLYEKVLETITAFFNDSSKNKIWIHMHLNLLINEIEMLIDSLDE